MKITRLRLLGFKSFVEPTELLIERGLTGVVGPNGCGKSNLLEALRWVMGETSHKSMRAAAMDDVIFAGTTTRPGRNSAEVTIFLDNSARKAPAEFNDRDDIEITRRIEREAGSAYRINGREARARDVKILFEDAATGARSPALVRQGQIGEIVNAKPEQRRRILEDAAGVAGLHSRRHEAELRLRAAEGNLTRLNDVLGGLSSQIESLKRQARQARRYKEISAELRKQEALLLHLCWAEAQALVETEEANLAAGLSRLALATEAEAKALREEAAHAETLPPLRDKEAACGAAVARLKIEADSLEREANRAAERQRELEARVAQLTRDIAREEALVAEARDILARLDAEIATLSAADEAAAAADEAARARLGEAEAELAEAEQRLTRLTKEAAEARAKRESLEATWNERRGAVAKIERQLAALEAQTREIAGRAPDAEKLAATTEEGQRLAREVVAIEAEAVTAEERVRDLALAAKARREESAAARIAINALKTERETLVKLLVLATGDYPPIIDSVRVAPGYEAALGAALGDDLDASSVAEAPVHWRRIDISPDDGSLPNGVEPLSAYVDGPPELERRLRQIGIVTREQGALLQRYLKPGQRLVSPDGDLWRWDGYVAAAHGATAAAQRLAERNRLAEIERREKQALADAAELFAAEDAAAAALAEAERDERTLRQVWRETQAKLAETRDALTIIERAARETAGRLATVAEARTRAEQDLAEASARLAEVDAAREALAKVADLEPALAEAQSDAARYGGARAEARAAVLSLERERQARAERMRAASAERQQWATRSASAEEQAKVLADRLAEANTELAAMADVPALIEEKRGKLFDALTQAEGERRAAADALAQAENAQRAAAQALRAAQAAVAAEREERARTETRLEGARTRRQDEARRIRETFNVAPDGCLPLAELAPGAALPSLAEVDQRLTRMRADRERLGGVNLQADEELTVLSEQFAAMDTERSDVEEAIAKLRGAIGQLNREAKKRLQDAFEQVDGHFRRLFTTLFGGGEARLAMVESEEDPLEGGLEIIAKPPGKKPATLSLLSGGEQTLTALSLIFAVFLTNPSPICVLDEVDAPLDDANVDRFCTLMEMMSKEIETRFLVITHHPMTMSRMSRLFGVTMAEKGVSQLVSVDLETAQRFREAG